MWSFPCLILFVVSLIRSFVRSIDRQIISSTQIYYTHHNILWKTYARIDAFILESLGGQFYKYFLCGKYLIPIELSVEGAFCYTVHQDMLSLVRLPLQLLSLSSFYAVKCRLNTPKHLELILLELRLSFSFNASEITHTMLVDSAAKSI